MSIRSNLLSINLHESKKKILDNMPGLISTTFVTLLEYAEEELHCTDIIVCLKKDRADRQQLVRTFMFLGFTVLPPGHSLLPNPLDTINLYMRYSIE